MEEMESRFLCFQGTTGVAIAVLVIVALGSVFKFLPCNADDQVRSFCLLSYFGPYLLLALGVDM